MYQEQPPTVKGRELVESPRRNCSLMCESPSMSSMWCPVTSPPMMADRASEVVHGGGRVGMAAAGFCWFYGRENGRPWRRDERGFSRVSLATTRFLTSMESFYFSLGLRLSANGLGIPDNFVFANFCAPRPKAETAAVCDGIGPVQQTAHQA